MQQNQSVAYASRAMSSSEISYAQIEKELLAIVYGCERFNMFTYGADIEVLSDHKPLESIFNYRSPNFGREVDGIMTS